MSNAAGSSNSSSSSSAWGWWRRRARAGVASGSVARAAAATAARVEMLEGRRYLANPVAVDDGGEFVPNYTMNERTAEAPSLTVSAANGVLANDSDADGGTLRAILFSPPSNGTVTLEQDGSFVYSPNEDFYGFDTFQYRARDPEGNYSQPATVKITVQNLNDSPTPQPDAYTTGKNQTLVRPAATGVLANDTDPDITEGNPTGDVLVVSLAFGVPLPTPGAQPDPSVLPSHGTVTLNPDGSFTYTPDLDFVGQDTFSYYIYDSLGGINGATVTITVTEEVVKQPPVAFDDTYAAIDEDTTLTVNAGQGLLANDSDADGDSIRAFIFEQPAHGTVTIEEDGSFVYTPAANYYGTDSFKYRARDSDSNFSNVATVHLTINPANDAPTAPNLTASRSPGAGVSITVLSTASDPDPEDAGMLQFEIVTPPTGGTALRHENATPDNPYDDYIVYTPNPGTDPATDSFTYRIIDPQGASATGTVTVTLNAAAGTAELQTNPFSSSKKDLVVVGTGVKDDILVVDRRDGSFNVTINGVFLGKFRPTGQIIINGMGGSDRIVTSSFKRGALIYGGTGNDTIIAGAGRDIIVGGDGNDTIDGGAHRNLLIGGNGADTLSGTAFNNILVGGRTSFDAPASTLQRAALEAILAAWASGTDAFGTRVTTIRSTGVITAVGTRVRLRASSITNDGVADVLGNNTDGPDWFLRSTGDQITPPAVIDRVQTI